MTCLIIGGNAAGMSAAARLKRKQPDMQVMVLERTDEVSYGACGMPYYIAGFNEVLDRMRIRKPQAFQEQGIELYRNALATKIDLEKQCVVWMDQMGKQNEQHYDQLVLAMGASPIVPPIENVTLENVFTLKTLYDAERIKACLVDETIRTVAIVGGGYIGLELAEACLHRGKTLHIFESLPNLLNTFDPEFGEAAAATLQAAGAQVHLNQRVSALVGEKRVIGLMANQVQYQVDAVILAVGVRPNTELASEVAFAKLKNGALVVDAHMHTTVPGVYAAGDCGTVIHKLTGKPAYLPLGTNANRQGRYAADVILGRDTEGYRALGTSMLRCMKLELARTGLREQEALEAGYDAHSITVQANSHARYYPNPVSLTLKLCYERTTKRLLGGQIMGTGEAAWRIDILACAIDCGMTAAQLGRLDLGYAPPFSSVWDAVQIAANAIK